MLLLQKGYLQHTELELSFFGRNLDEESYDADDHHQQDRQVYLLLPCERWQKQYLKAVNQVPKAELQE